MTDHVHDLIMRQHKLASARSQWDTHWQELAEYLLPKRADFTTSPAPGAKRTDKQFDGVPMQAARGLAASLDGLLKPKTQRWFALRTGDEALDDDAAVKAWLRTAEDRLFGALYDPGSRFLQRSAEVDLDLVVFGTAILFIGERLDGAGLSFQSLPLSSTYIAENADGEIDTIFRVTRLSARQAEQRFGRDNLGAKTREALAGPDAVPDKEFPFLQAVMPRTERDPKKADKGNMAFTSIVIDVESEHKVGEGGFREFPFVVPRWDTATGEVYGRSPAMLALPDVKTLHQMGKTILEAGHKVVNPPLLVPNDGIGINPRTFPGGITPFDPGLLLQTQGRPPITPLITGANIPLGREMQNDVREQIWAAFFTNGLQLPVDGPQMTATEIIERKAEFMRVIGPVFGRLESDYTGPLVERAFAVLQRAGMLPPPPDALRDSEARFEFVSPITRAQKQIDAAALRKTAEDIAPMVSAKPEVLDNFDADRISREVADANGLPADWLRSGDDVRRIRDDRARAARAEQQAADAERLVEGAAKAAGIPGVARAVTGAAAMEGTP